VTNLVENPACIHEWHEHEPEVLLPQDRFSKAPPQLPVGVGHGVAHEAVDDESAQGGVTAQAIGITVSKRNSGRRVERYVAKLHHVGEPPGQDQPSGIAEQIVIAPSAESDLLVIELGAERFGRKAPDSLQHHARSGVRLKVARVESQTDFNRVVPASMVAEDLTGLLVFEQPGGLHDRAVDAVSGVIAHIDMSKLEAELWTKPATPIIPLHRHHTAGLGFFVVVVAG